MIYAKNELVDTVFVLSSPNTVLASREHAQKYAKAKCKNRKEYWCDFKHKCI